MSRRCDICGKGPLYGNKISKSHNVSKRVWYPNVQSVRAVQQDGTKLKLKVCTKCIKAGKVKKA